MATINPGMIAGLTYGTAMKNKDLDKAASEVSNGKSIPNEDWLDPKYKRSTYRASGIDQTPVQTSFNTPYEQYASQQIGSLGDAYSDRAAHEAFSAREHLMGSNSDEITNERYQKLIEREAELKKEIAELNADIAYQKKLRALEMKNDPMWDIAKQQYIMKGDSSGLENIMSRMEAEKGRKITEETAKAAKKQEDQSKKEANLRAANTARAILEDAYDVYMANKASKENQIQGRSNLFRAYQDFKDKADAAGKDYNDFFADKTFMQNVDLELQEALATTQAETEKKVASAKVAANVTALKNTVKSAVDSWNTGTHTSKETNDEIDRLKAAYPQFDFKKKGGKIEQSYNPKKDGKK